MIRGRKAMTTIYRAPNTPHCSVCWTHQTITHYKTTILGTHQTRMRMTSTIFSGRERRRRASTMLLSTERTIWMGAGRHKVKTLEQEREEEVCWV